MTGPICYCGSPSSLRSNSLLYNGKEYGTGKAWICDRFPECRGNVGAHPDGTPLGTIADEETKALRKQLHAAIDPLWMRANNGRSRQRNRASVYRWLARITNLPTNECHIAAMNDIQCKIALEAIEEEPFSQAIESVL